MLMYEVLNGVKSTTKETRGEERLTGLSSATREVVRKSMAPLLHTRVVMV